MLQWLGISCICDQYIDVVYVIGLNAKYQMSIVARVRSSFKNRSSLFGELYPIKEVDNSFRNLSLLYFIYFFLRKNVWKLQHFGITS